MSFTYTVEIRCDACRQMRGGCAGKRMDPNFNERSVRASYRKNGWTTQKVKGGKIDLCRACSEKAGLPIKHTLRKLKGGVG